MSIVKETIEGRFTRLAQQTHSTWESWSHNQRLMLGFFTLEGAEKVLLDEGFPLRDVEIMGFHLWSRSREYYRQEKLALGQEPQIEWEYVWDNSSEEELEVAGL